MMWTVFLYIVSKVEYLTYDEFTYLLPLCVNKETTDMIIKSIKESRKGKMNYEDIILSVLMKMDNYKTALAMLQEEEISEELICNIGINRKGMISHITIYTGY